MSIASLATVAADVVRVTRQFGFQNFGSKVLAVTFTGRIENGPIQTFVVNNPSQGWNRKDGKVTISNTYACWGWRNYSNGGTTVTVSDFKPQTIETVKGGLALWTHTS